MRYSSSRSCDRRLAVVFESLDSLYELSDYLLGLLLRLRLVFMPFRGFEKKTFRVATVTGMGSSMLDSF